jgi:hypothetical protein
MTQTGVVWTLTIIHFRFRRCVITVYINDPARYFQVGLICYTHFATTNSTCYSYPLVECHKKNRKFMYRRNSITKNGSRLILHIFARPVMFIGQKLKFKITRFGTENPISIVCPRKKSWHVAIAYAARGKFLVLWLPRCSDFVSPVNARGSWMEPDSFSFISLDPLSTPTRLTCANFIQVFAFSVSLLRSRRLSENWRYSRLETCVISGFTTTATIQTGFTVNCHCLLSHPRKPVREANCDPW